MKTFIEFKEHLDESVGTVRHFASLVRKHNELNHKEGVAWSSGNRKQHKIANDKLKNITAEIAKHYGHLKDDDGLKLR